MPCVQGMASIDKDIEAESLKALAAQSRLNSTLTSVYARSPAQQEISTAERADCLHAPAVAEAAAKLAQTKMPVSTAAAQNAPSVKPALAAKVASIPVPDVQQPAGPLRQPHEQQDASIKEAPVTEAWGGVVQNILYLQSSLLLNLGAA